MLPLIMQADLHNWIIQKIRKIYSKARKLRKVENLDRRFLRYWISSEAIFLYIFLMGNCETRYKSKDNKKN